MRFNAGRVNVTRHNVDRAKAIRLRQQKLMGGLRTDVEIPAGAKELGKHNKKLAVYSRQNPSPLINARLDRDKREAMSDFVKTVRAARATEVLSAARNSVEEGDTGSVIATMKMGDLSNSNNIVDA